MNNKVKEIKEQKVKQVHSRVSEDMYDDLMLMCQEFKRSVSDMTRTSIGYTIENWKEEKGGSITLDVLGEETELFKDVCGWMGIDEQDYVNHTLKSLGKVMKGETNEEEE